MPRRARLDAIGFDTTLRVENFDLPDPGPGQVVLEVGACAVCHRDLIDRGGRFPWLQLPITPGHEAAGTVVAVRVLDEKSIYNELEDRAGRMMTVHRGDVLVGVLGERRALRGYAGEVPHQVVVGDVLHLLNLGGLVGRCTSANPEVGPPARVQVSVIVW